MNKDELMAYCKTKAGAYLVYKKEWEAFLAMLEKKFFALIGENKQGEPVISLKCDPFKAEDLRLAFAGIITPGYYLNKKHWNTVLINNNVLSPELMKQMINDSYELVFKSFSKKIQSAIINSK